MVHDLRATAVWHCVIVMSRIGEHPHTFYFTDKYDIFLIDTVHGKVSATHGISYSSPGPKGIHIRNGQSID